MSARTRAQTRSTGHNAFCSPISFHQTATTRSDLLRQFTERPGLFLESRISEEMMERVYLVIQLKMRTPGMTLEDLASMLASIHKSFEFITLRRVVWWRICRGTAGRRGYKWRRQSIIMATSGEQISTDMAAATLKDSFMPETIGLSGRKSGGRKVLKWPFFGPEKALQMAYDGTPYEKPLGPEDGEALRLRLREKGVWVPDPRDSDTQKGPEDAQMAEEVVEKACPCPLEQGQTSILSFLPTQPEPEREREGAVEEGGLTEAQDQPADNEEIHTPPSATCAPEARDQDGGEVCQEKANEVKGDGEEPRKANKKAKEMVKCNRFKRPTGLVPKILHGQRGRKLIRLLSSNSQVSGRKLVLAWLNTPRMFERPRVVMGERDVSVDDNRRRRISLRKFRYGNVGASWKALKSETVAKIVPSDEQVAALFPEEEEGDKTLVYSSQGAPRSPYQRRSLRKCSTSSRETGQLAHPN